MTNGSHPPKVAKKPSNKKAVKPKQNTGTAKKLLTKSVEQRAG